jgi:hypothetical protein
VVESRPDALEGSAAELAVGGVDGVGDGANDGVLEKRPQGPGSEAQASDFVGEPDTEGSSAAATPMTVAAKDPPCSGRSSLWIVVVKTREYAVSNERSDDLAVWTGGLFEPLDDGDPFFFVAVEPSVSFVAHVDPMLPGSR